MGWVHGSCKDFLCTLCTTIFFCPLKLVTNGFDMVKPRDPTNNNYILFHNWNNFRLLCA
jgi:hypothetical protein